MKVSTLTAVHAYTNSKRVNEYIDFTFTDVIDLTMEVEQENTEEAPTLPTITPGLFEDEDEDIVFDNVEFVKRKRLLMVPV